MMAKSEGEFAGRPYAAAKFCSKRVVRSRAIACSSSALRWRAACDARCAAPAAAKRAGNFSVHSSHETAPVSRHHRSRHATCTARTLPTHPHGAHISPPPSAEVPRQMRHSPNARGANGFASNGFASNVVGFRSTSSPGGTSVESPSALAATGFGKGGGTSARVPTSTASGAGGRSTLVVVSERSTACATVASAVVVASGRAFDASRVARLGQSAESSARGPSP
mmetsp:Transcript_1646/g.6564  ORF Transcript_1646/g.6564 Transcript_1646/m.6564 type:complete len:224 (-) Transcript_1646:146-817(-)